MERSYVVSNRYGTGSLWSMYAAWLIALISTLGALFIGEVMGQTPCLLCWYQRIAMFPLALILGIGCYQSDLGVKHYTLPLAAVGAVIALWHTLLYFGLTPKAIEPCNATASCSGSDMTIFNVLPLPLLSLGAFLSIALLLFHSKSKRDI